MKLGPHLSSAFRDLGIRLDARGLISLASARKRVRAAKVFERGKSHVILGQRSQPTDGDYLWASLLSLDNAAEFVREASRIVWKFSPRGGFDNIAPWERYGDAIVPWLATFIDKTGRLSPNPWCVVPCLAAIGDKRALEVLLRIRIKRGTDIREVVRAWLKAHGKSGWRALDELASEGHVRAREIVLAEAKRSPKARGGASALLTEAMILETLDVEASSASDGPLPWPVRGASVGHFEPHAVRVIAARSRTGDDWGILFEVVQGDLLKGPRDEIRWPITIQHYRYGSRVPSGGRYLVDSRPIGMHLVLPRGFARCAFAVPASFDGVRVVGPKGTKPFELTDALVKKLRLEPGRACSDRIEDWPSVIAVRARLAQDPGAVWSDAKALAKKVLRIRDPLIVVETDAFEHVSGPAFGVRGSDARVPSTSKTMCSIAAAIVHRDSKRFVAGTANVDWRAQPRKRRR